MKRLAYIALLCTTVVIISCNFSGKLTKRYHNYDFKPDDKGDGIKTYVDVNAYIIEKEKTDPLKPKTIFELSEKGQEELIKQSAAKETTNEKLMSALTLPLSAKSPTNVELIDYTKADKRVVVSIRNLTHYPADRISKIMVSLKIHPDFKLLSCNKLTTEYQTIDLGKLNYSNTNAIELAGNLSSGLNISSGTTDLSEITTSSKEGDLVTGSKTSNTAIGSRGTTTSKGVTGKFNAARSFSEEVLLRQRIVSLNASISENTLFLFQESISGIDLTGNILADIVFDSKKDIAVERSYSFSELYIGSTPNTADKLKIKETLIAFYNYDKDITAELSYGADFRHVNKRDRTITESDDDISLYYGQLKNPKKITLISKDQLKPKLWILFVKGDVAELPVQIQSPSTGGKGELIFHSYTDAKDFLIWIKLKAADIIAKKGALGGSGHNLFKPDQNAIDASTIQNLEIGVAQ